MIRDTSAQDTPLDRPSRVRPWRRWAVRIVIAAVVAVGLGTVLKRWIAADRAIDRSRIRIAAVTRGTIVRDVVADGRVVAANAPTLYAIAAGTVDFKVRAGDKVTANQLLATVASPELHSKLTQEQATLAGLEASVGRGGLDVEHGRANAQKLVAQAEIDRQTAAREVEINQQMYSHGVISELELRRSEDLLKKAEIAVQHAKVGELDIKSPVDGQVGQLLVAQRATVAANAPIINVIDLGAFELEIKVPDSFARDLALGMGAEIRNGSDTFAGKVRSVSPEVVEGNVATRIEFGDKRPAGLRQNQRLTARILIEEKPNVLYVERGPFVESGGGNSAYFVDSGIAEKRAIKIGAIALDKIEIQAGAQVGDQIVVAGADAFGDAQRVRIAE